MPTTTKILVFDLHKSKVLNANTYKSLHWAVKGKMTDYLRTLAATDGLTHHADENKSAVEERLSQIREESTRVVAKARLTKRLQKSELTKEEIKKEVDEAFANDDNKKVLATPVLFDHYTVGVSVAPPTRRRLDPPNLYPTVKALVDGLTDASWWEDDDFSHLHEIGFTYGGLSGSKDMFQVVLTITGLSEEDVQRYAKP